MNFHIRNGLNLVSIGLSEIGSYFYFKRPLSTVWFDCHGSVGKYLCLLPYDEEYRKEVRERINENLDSDYTANTEQLKILLEPLFTLFPNGEYALNFYNGINGWYFDYQNPNEKNSNSYWDVMFTEVTNIEDQDLKLKQLEALLLEKEKEKKQYHTDILAFTTCNFYDGEDNSFIATQPRSEINPGRVKYFEEEITKGKRPFAIIFKCRLNEKLTNIDNSVSDYSMISDRYILDGHHKLLAYQNLKINPAIAEITYLPKRRYEVDFNVEELIEVMFPWQVQHILTNWYDKEKHILQYLENPKSKIHQFVKNGHVKEFYKNGQIKHEAFYINDNVEGESKTWFENGQLQSVEYFKNRARTGEWKSWYESGKIQFVQRFNDKGQYDGHIASYYENGQSRWEQFYKNGTNVDGYSYLTWYENGTKEAELKYLNGRMTERKNYDRTGKLTSFEELDVKSGRMIKRK